MVHEYFDKKMLADLGHTFEGDNLTVFEVDCYKIISSQVSSLEERENKKRN